MGEKPKQRKLMVRSWALTQGPYSPPHDFSRIKKSICVLKFVVGETRNGGRRTEWRRHAIAELAELSLSFSPSGWSPHKKFVWLPPSQRNTMAVKTHTWISLWFLLTVPVIAWDVGYCFMRFVNFVFQLLVWFLTCWFHRPRSMKVIQWVLVNSMVSSIFDRVGIYIGYGNPMRCIKM